MDPSQVRKRILKDHVEIRAEVDELEEMLNGIVFRDPEIVHELRIRGGRLLRKLMAHIDFEDAVLVPTIRNIDMWGTDRADELLRHHEEQRTDLNEVLDLCEGRDVTPRKIARRFQDLIYELRADMAHEERAYLSEDLLRDDIVAIHLQAG